MQNDLERWARLVDRMAAEEPLSDEERAFCEAFEHTHAACGTETELYEQLAYLDGTPNAASRALVDRTLAQLEREEVERAAAEVRLLRRPRGTPLWAAGAAVAIAALALYGVRTQRAGRAEAARAALQPLARAELVYSSGNVNVSGQGAATGHALLQEGSSLETGEGSACVLIDSDINICLDAHSRMRLRTIAAPGRVVELEAGKLATRLATQPEGMSLSIVARGVASTAVGTAYSVEFDANGAVVTTVLNGKVRVGRSGQSVLISAHERAVTVTTSARAGTERAGTNHQSPVVTSVSRGEEAPSWALLGPTVLWHDPVAATLAIRGEPSGAEAVLDDQTIGVAPLWTLVPVGEHHLVVRRAGAELISRKLHLHAGELQDVGYREPGDENPPPSAADTVIVHANTPSRPIEARASKASAARRGSAAAMAKVAKPSANPAVQAEAAGESGADLLRRARQAVRDGRFADASQSYETLIASAGDSSEAHTARVLLGQLRLRQLQDPQGALKVLNAYLRLGGSLALDARVARIEALHALGRSEEESAAIEDFLRRHARSFEAKALRARLDALRDSRAPSSTR